MAAKCGFNWLSVMRRPVRRGEGGRYVECGHAAASESGTRALGGRRVADSLETQQGQDLWSANGRKH